MLLNRNGIIILISVSATNDGLLAVVELSNGDMRRALNLMQSANAAYDRIEFNEVFITAASPLPSDVDAILSSLLNDDFQNGYNRLQYICRTKGYALLDILVLLFEKIQQLDMKHESKIFIYEQMAEIEHRLASGCHDQMQLGSLVGVFQIK